MAADNRNFVNKFANEGGGDILCEDKRFEELKSATAKTSSQISTTTDYIPLQDTDGNLVKINPASFEEAVRNVLGGLLANNDKGTTISGVPALSGSGASLDFGSVTPANLASVLGGIRFGKGVPNLDFNNATEPGVYVGWSTFSNTAFGSWTGILTLLVLPKTNNCFLQIHIAPYSNDMFLCMREMGVEGSFNDWYKIQIPKVTA